MSKYFFLGTAAYREFFVVGGYNGTVGIGDSVETALITNTACVKFPDGVFQNMYN